MNNSQTSVIRKIYVLAFLFCTVPLSAQAASWSRVIDFNTGLGASLVGQNGETANVYTDNGRLVVEPTMQASDVPVGFTRLVVFDSKVKTATAVRWKMETKNCGDDRVQVGVFAGLHETSDPEVDMLGYLGITRVAGVSAANVRIGIDESDSFLNIQGNFGSDNYSQKNMEFPDGQARRFMFRFNKRMVGASSAGLPPMRLTIQTPDASRENARQLFFAFWGSDNEENNCQIVIDNVELLHN